jgi:hypothetical protein
LVGVLLACQGELKLNNPEQVTSPLDFAVEADLAGDPGTMPGFVSFADIQRDLERSGYLCTNPGCHSGNNPPGMMIVTPNALGSMAALQQNYSEVKARVNTSNPETSVLLQKTLKTDPTMHSGIKPFNDTSDPVYQRWLTWIRLGAKFEPVSTSTQDM